MGIETDDGMDSGGSSSMSGPEECWLPPGCVPSQDTSTLGRESGPLLMDIETDDGMDSGGSSSMLGPEECWKTETAWELSETGVPEWRGSKCCGGCSEEAAKAAPK